jgi:endoglucanase
MRWRALCMLLLVLIFSLPPADHAVAADPPRGAGYWHAVGPQLLDAAGRPVRIVGVTWYGMETANWVPAGLDTQRYETILDQVKMLGYNVVRLPFSNELVERNPVVTHAVRANPELNGMHALDVLDRLVAHAGHIGLKFILDDHRSHAARPLEINSLDEPLWYTGAFPWSAWLSDWRTLARRYRGNDTVVGFDLRNEPHTGGSGPWNLHAYLHRGATWGPYKGKSDSATDWRAAAQLAGNAILAINPEVLIVVEGITLYPDPTSPSGVVSSWWGGILTPAVRFPVKLTVPGKLVYSVHDYGPRKHAMPWFKPLSYASLDKAYRHNWAFVPGGSNAPTVPLLLGEFGTCTNDPACIDARSPNNQATWFGLLLRWLRLHPSVGWSFYALNGTNANRCATNNGLLNAQWNGVSNPALQRDLAHTQPFPGATPKTSAPLIQEAPPAQRPRSVKSSLCQLP